MRNSLGRTVRVIYSNYIKLISAPRKHTLRFYNLILRAKTVVFTIVSKNSVYSAPSAEGASVR